MKKIFCVVFAVIFALMSFSAAVFADSAEGSVLKFSQDGKFRIVHLTDVQDVYPLNATTKEFIKEMLAQLKPDLIVLGGDNCVADAEHKEAAIEELCSLFVENETYFTLVFGNHDHQQHFESQEDKTGQSEGIREYLLGLYQQYGGDYCLAYDAEPALTGVGTHNLTIAASNSDKPAFNLYMMDSNAYYPNENEDKGYDGVHPDEIEWYKNKAAQLKEANGGECVPAMMFQHIVVQEAYDALFIESPSSMGDMTATFEDIDGNEKYYTYLPKVGGIKEGFMLEHPCPNYRDYGQFTALVETGDVMAIFSGHDHVNNYTLNIEGIDVVNSAGCTFHSYGDHMNRGVRVIDLDEKDLSTYSTFTYTLAEQALKEGSTLTTLGDISKADAVFAVIGSKLLAVLMKVLSAVFFFVK
ncbi:MAG: metallophosphoesterase [Clostridia bacterium]|nr:metallophosphoesterase [Clostridia bacterium]